MSAPGAIEGFKQNLAFLMAVDRYGSGVPALHTPVADAQKLAEIDTMASKLKLLGMNVQGQKVSQLFQLFDFTAIPFFLKQAIARVVRKPTTCNLSRLEDL